MVFYRKMHPKTRTKESDKNRRKDKSPDLSFLQEQERVNSPGISFKARISKKELSDQLKAGELKTLGLHTERVM